jgi:hypothetical protein
LEIIFHPDISHGHGQFMTDWLRSRRPGNGDEVNAWEIRFARRHHPLTLVEVRKIAGIKATKSGNELAAI